MNRPTKLFRSLALLLAFFGAGEAIAYVSALPIPGSILGMILLSVALASGILPLERVEAGANALLSELGLLFVPPGVALMTHLDVLRAEWLPLLAATLASLLMVLATTAVAAQVLERKDRHG